MQLIQETDKLSKAWTGLKFVFVGRREYENVKAPSQVGSKIQLAASGHTFRPVPAV